MVYMCLFAADSENGEVSADSMCCHFETPAEDKERPKERKKTVHACSHNPAKGLLAMFMFAASFHHSVCCFFSLSFFFVKQKSVRCWSPLKSERQ